MFQAELTFSFSALSFCARSTTSALSSEHCFSELLRLLEASRSCREKNKQTQKRQREAAGHQVATERRRPSSHSALGLEQLVGRLSALGLFLAQRLPEAADELQLLGRLGQRVVLLDERALQALLRAAQPEEHTHAFNSGLRPAGKRQRPGSGICLWGDFCCLAVYQMSPLPSFHSQIVIGRCAKVIFSTGVVTGLL